MKKTEILETQRPGFKSYLNDSRSFLFLEPQLFKVNHGNTKSLLWQFFGGLGTNEIIYANFPSKDPILGDPPKTMANVSTQFVICFLIDFLWDVYILEAVLLLLFLSGH